MRITQVIALESLDNQRIASCGQIFCDVVCGAWRYLHQTPMVLIEGIGIESRFMTGDGENGRGRNSIEDAVPVVNDSFDCTISLTHVGVLRWRSGENGSSNESGYNRRTEYEQSVGRL